MNRKRVRIPFFISHKGCPHRCLFCDQSVISGSEGHFPSSREILEKISIWQSSAPDAELEVAFFGGTFTSLPETVQNDLLLPLQPLIKEGTIGSVRISTRPDRITREIVERVAALGVDAIELGVQSMNDTVLNDSGRGHTASDSSAAIKCIKSMGLHAVAQLMPGLPGDTSASALKSLDEVIEAGTDSLRIYPAVVLRGTGLAELYERGGFRPQTLEDAVRICAEMLLRAAASGIPVIRMGLQASEELKTENNVIAGPYHPAFGHLVISELFHDRLLVILKEAEKNGHITVKCHPCAISEVIGHGRINLTRLEKAGGWEISVKTEKSIPRYSLQVSIADNSERIDLFVSSKSKEECLCPSINPGNAKKVAISE